MVTACSRLRCVPGHAVVGVQCVVAVMTEAGSLRYLSIFDCFLRIITLNKKKEKRKECSITLHLRDLKYCIRVSLPLKTQNRDNYK